MKKTSLALFTFVACMAAWPALAEVSKPTGVIYTLDGGEMKGEITWRNASKRFDVVDGRKSTYCEADNVEKVEVDRPKELDAAIKKAAAGDESAIAVLEEISDVYNNLTHDIEAAAWLSDLYLKKGKTAEVIKLVKEKARLRPEVEYKGPLAKRYWEALITEGKSSDLEKQLEKALASEEDEVIANAYVARGNAAMAKGANSANYKEALLAGYLRVILLYNDPSYDAYAEALYKGAKAFAGMGHGSRANGLRATLKKDCAKSKWAKMN